MPDEAKVCVRTSAAGDKRFCGLPSVGFPFTWELNAGLLLEEG